MTGEQLRAARKLLGWSAAGLERLCNLPRYVVGKFERSGRMEAAMHGDKTVDRVRLLQSALEEGGVVFTDGEESGVKLREVEP